MVCKSCGKEVPAGSAVCPSCGAKLMAEAPAAAPQPAAQPAAAAVSPKSRMVVTLLSFFLGEFGAHRFYLGKIGTAVAMLVTLGGLGIWALVDFIFAVAGIMKDKEGKVIKNW